MGAVHLFKSSFYDYVLYSLTKRKSGCFEFIECTWLTRYTPEPINGVIFICIFALLYNIVHAFEAEVVPCYEPQWRQHSLQVIARRNCVKKLMRSAGIPNRTAI